MSVLNAGARVFYLAFISAAVFQIRDPLFLSALALLHLLLLTAALRKQLRTLLLLMPFVITYPVTVLLFFLSGLGRSGLYSEILASAFLDGSLYWLRFFVIVTANLLLFSGLDRHHLVSFLNRVPLPRSLRIILFSIINFLPLFVEESRRIYEVQICRGIRPSHLLTRHHLMPLFIPVLSVIIQRSSEMAVTLIIRGEFR